MLKEYYPCEYVENVFSIDYNKLYSKGYEAIIFDIDNTLVPHGEDSTEEVDELFKKVQAIGFKTLLLSNNNKERIERFLKNIDSMYIEEADKPEPKNYFKAVEMLKTDKKKVVVIGDQVFYDILGANRAGIDSILVKFIGYYTEKNIGIRRTIEKLILKTYKLRKKYQNRIGNIEMGEQ